MNDTHTLAALRTENSALQAHVTALHTELAALHAENAALREALAAAQGTIEQVRGELAPALAQVAELTKRGERTTPPFVRAKTPARAKKEEPRTKRAAEHNKGRPRQTPTHIVQHAYERCPDCDYRLRGESVAWRRQVLEIPEPPPLEVIEHQYLKRFCPHCQVWHTPPADERVAVGRKGRLGPRLVSLIAYLRTVARVPLELIQEVLQTLHGMHLSVGGLQEALDRLVRQAAPVLAALQAQARASPGVHMDETGWREDGQNGYVWTLCTTGPQAVRYYTYDHSRAGAVARRLLGTYRGYLHSDFYAAYGGVASKHQYCWVHLLRDLHALKEQHPTAWHVVGWARAVRHLYDIACAVLQETSARPVAERTLLARVLDARLQQLGRRYARTKKHPCQALAKRLLRHQGQYFPFLYEDGVVADNNAAERALRPVVVMRKISGGTRSPQGSTTRLGLASLFGTWQARGLNPFHECVALLS